VSGDLTKTLVNGLFCETGQELITANNGEIKGDLGSGMGTTQMLGGQV
jgi:hypothetical protein